MPDVTKQVLTADELRKQRKMGEQMGDIEFQMEIAPYSNYTADIDPSIARFHGLKEHGFFEPRGFSAPKGATEEELKNSTIRYIDKSRVKHELVPEAGTVNASGIAAIPRIWNHEYGHQTEGTDEEDRRILDGFQAQTEDDWDGAIDMWRNWKSAKHNKKMTPSEAERDLIGRIHESSGFGPVTRSLEREFKRGATLPEDEQKWYATDEQDYPRMRREKSIYYRRKKELEEFDAWNEGIGERNKKRKKDNPKSDTLKEIKVPEIELKKQKMTADALNTYIEMVRADAEMKKSIEETGTW